MRVLQLIQKPQRRGAEVFAAELTSWLRGVDVDARMFALYRHEGAGLEFGPDDIAFGAAEGDFSEAALNPRLLARLVQAVRRFKPDVVQANGGRTLKYALALRRLGAPRALWVYRNIDSPSFWLKGPRRVLMPLLVRRAFDAAVGVSARTMSQVHDIYGFRDASEVIENGVDFSRLGEPRRPETPIGPRILWIGALGPQKRPDVAIDVVASIPGASLTMLGEGPWRERVESQIDSRGLRDRVHLAGNQRDVGSFLRDARLLLITSDTEGIPAVAIEAQYCGVPVVGFAVGALDECVIDGVTGLLVPHGAADELARAAARLLEDDQAWMAMAAAACENAKRFAMSAIGPRYLTFYQRMQQHGGLSVS